MTLSLSLCVILALCLCTVVPQVSADQSSDSFGVAFSSESLNELLNTFILPVVHDVIAGIGAELPSNCCYENIEVNHTRLYLENLTIPEDSIVTSGVIQTNTHGVFVQVNANFDLTFYVDYCTELAGRCDPLFFCRGDSVISFESSTRFLLVIRADSNGEPVILVEDFNFHVSAPSKKGLCELFDIVIDTIIPLINGVANLVLPDIINTELYALTSVLPQTIAVPGDNLFDFQWSLSNSTASSLAGASLMFDLEVIILSVNKSGPFLPDPAVPNALSFLAGNSAVTLDFSDAILNNIVYSVYSKENPSYTTKVDGFDVTADLESSPVFAFTNLTGLDSASLTLKVKAVLKKSVLRITSHSTIVSHFEVIVTPTGLLTIQLDPENFVVTVDSTSPPVTNGTKTLIENSIESEWTDNVPTINALLMSKAIQLPPIASFNNPYIEYGNGYAAFGFETASPDSLREYASQGLVKKIAENRMEAINAMLISKGSRAVACPNLSAVGAQEIPCK